MAQFAGALRKTEVGMWQHVYAPTKGLVTSVSSTLLPKEASPYMNRVYLKAGEIRTDFGLTKFPTAGSTKSNVVHGVPLLFKQFTKTDGTAQLLCFTTTNIYLYNTSTDTWDCVTRGTLVDNAETAWTAQANVTCTRDSTIKVRGTYSSKSAIAAAFTTGIASTFDIGATDCTSATALHFWIYSSVATAANDLKIGVSETSALGAGVLYFNVPALTANTWTACCVDGDFSGYNAVISVGLNVVVDNGAQNVYIDDVMAVTRYTGDGDNLWSVATLNDTFIATNGIDQPQKYTGSGFFSALATALAAGSITTSELVFTFKDHVCFCNNTENAADTPARISWGDIGKTEVYTGGTSGYQDLTDDASWAIAAEQIGENEYIIYKENSIVKMIWVGGHTPFRFKTMVDHATIAGKEAVANVGGMHYVFGVDTPYVYNGGTSIKYLPDTNRQYVYDLIDRTYINRIKTLYIEEDAEIQFLIPSTTQYPDITFCVDRELGVWYRRDRALTGYGSYHEVTAKTIGDLIGTIGEQDWTFGDSITKSNTPLTIVGDSNGKIFKLDKTTLNDDGTAISSEWQTPDFTYPSDDQYENKYFRVPQLLYEAKGQTITTEWSDDGGSTWSPTGTGSTNTQALTSSWEIYQQDFDVVARKIRFKFSKSTASQGFNLRYYGFYWIPRSGRS